MNIQHILWSNLVASPRNARKVKADIASLAMSLAADGLIQNLTVAPRTDGKFEVIAGERRRRAIVQLVKGKVWERDVTIPCEVREDGDGTGISYAENAQRVAMHPADAIRAFASLAADGHDEAAIAHRYGYDPREVRKMLALASVSPKVINALAADKIDLATAQAFTLTDDHNRQERVLRRARSLHEVRSLLTESKVTTGHRLFRFVGAESYGEAGGTVTRDLFDKEGGGYADDAELVERLASEKLDTAAAEAEAEGWSEVIATDQTYYSESYRWHRLYPDAEDGGFSAEAKAKGIVVLTVDHQGGISRTAYTKAAQRIVKRDETGTPLPRPLYDARMVEDLSQVRTAAIQYEVATNQHVAYAVLLDALLPLVAGDGYAPAHAVQLKGGSIQRPGSRFSVSTREIASPFDTVADLIAVMPEDAGERFDWLLSLDTPNIDSLMAACSGALIDATQGKYGDRARSQSVDRIARAVGLDMRGHWEGGIEFYDRLTRKTALAALEEARGTYAAENCAKLKKPELAAACNDRIPGSGWLPTPLLTPEVPSATEEPFEENGEALLDADNDDHFVPEMIAAE